MNDEIHEFNIEFLQNQTDFEQVMELQNLVFGETPSHQIPLPLLINYRHNGAYTLGVFDANDRLYGFGVAYLATDIFDPNRPAMANLKLVLERIAIHPDYRGTQLGTRLILQIRELGIKQAIRMLTMSFSPLNGRMAYIMIRKLGAIIEEYVPAYYPEGFGHWTPDQLVADWWFTKNRAEERISGNRKPLQLKHYQDAAIHIINPTDVRENGLAVPSNQPLHFDGTENMVLVEIPVDYLDLMYRDKFLAETWRHHSQSTMQAVFQAGYVATDFLYDTYEGRLRSFYLMSYDGPRSNE